MQCLVLRKILLTAYNIPMYCNTHLIKSNPHVPAGSKRLVGSLPKDRPTIVEHGLIKLGNFTPQAEPRNKASRDINSTPSFNFILLKVFSSLNVSRFI